MRTNGQPMILIIDDETPILDSVQRLLAGEYRCLTMNRADAALEHVRQHEEPVAAVICDMYMPQMDGLDLVGRLHAFCPETVCVLLTGGGDPNLAVRALNEGRIFHYLHKPCPADELKRIIRLAVSEHQRRLSQKSFTWKMHFKKDTASGIILGPGCFSVTGYRAGDFQTDPALWKSMIVPEDLAGMESFLQSACRQQPIETAEFRIRRKDRRSRWLRMAVFSRQGDPQSPCPIAEGFLEDITEQKEMELTTQQANKRYERMVANVPGMVFQCLLQMDGTLRFTFVSSLCRQYFQAEADQICHDSELMLKSFASEDLSRFYRQIAESAATLEPLTWQGGVPKEDRMLWFQITARPERLADGQVLWDGLMIDITALKEAEQNAQYIAMFSSENPNPVLRIRRDGIIVYANAAGRTLLSLWERTQGQQAPEEMIEAVAEVLQSGRILSKETRCKDQYFSIVFAPVSGNDAVNLYVREITAAKKAELELIELNQTLVEHDRLKSEFVSTVTHELRTPLCIFKNIISNALAGVTGPISPKLRENLEMAHQSVERLKRIISDFMDISEYDGGTAKPERKITFMQNLIKETVDSMRPLAQAKKISMTMNLPKTPVYADIDQARIVRVLENIIGNAIKFIPVKGSIYITVTDYLHGEFFDVCVKDSGPGMTRQEADKVFDRFVQARIVKGPGDHGTGLGLSIAKEIINLHGGHIWVETQPACGCAFFFRLSKADVSSSVQK